jgi:hypothetical protein
LIKLIKTARFVRGGCICNGCDVAVEPIHFNSDITTAAFTATTDKSSRFHLIVTFSFF